MAAVSVPASEPVRPSVPACTSRADQYDLLRIEHGPVLQAWHDAKQWAEAGDVLDVTAELLGLEPADVEEEVATCMVSLVTATVDLVAHTSCAAAALRASREAQALAGAGDLDGLATLLERVELTCRGALGPEGTAPRRMTWDDAMWLHRLLRTAHHVLSVGYCDTTDALVVTDVRDSRGVDLVPEAEALLTALEIWRELWGDDVAWLHDALPVAANRYAAWWDDRGRPALEGLIRDCVTRDS